MLLCDAGQGVDARSRRGGLGVLHRPGAHRDAMIPLLPQRARPLGAGSRATDRDATFAAIEPAAVTADWLRVARIARMLSWLTLGWLGVEAGVAIGAAVL